MFFLGDVAHPFNGKPKWPDFEGKPPLVVNLEGPLTGLDEQVLLKESVLFNHDSILSTLVDSNVVAACLANNHITDLPDGILDTQKKLSKCRILGFGAAKDKFSDLIPEPILCGNLNYIFLGFGWDVIQCKNLTTKREGVSPLKKNNVIAKVKEARTLYPNAILVCSFHWNYELELYPQPAHRQLAMLAIDCGADLIIGHHSHIVGGVEIYKNVPIVYSLGNWWLPQGVFFNGNIKYPEESFQQLAFEYCPFGNHKCHWFKYSIEKHELIFDGVEEVNKSKRILELTPFSGMGHQDYINWFKVNRKKSKALPVYKYLDAVFLNELKDVWIKLRHPLMLTVKWLSTVFRR
ncbi:CapA family protein [Pseudoalteromonas fenneropenaei]|uniref:CapA family protein n=1 Tax=Pseudoalteromonas fenneropenaei TaxID=1737459 RepID=A0ABV7CKE6_9GAMM